MRPVRYHVVANFVLAAITITQVFAVCLAVLTLALPAFLLFSQVAEEHEKTESDSAFSFSC